MQNILVIAEIDQGKLKNVTLAAVGFARQVCEKAGGSFEILVMGAGVTGIVEALRSFGAANVLVAEHTALAEPLADKYARVIAAVAGQRGGSMIIAAASARAKDILPRSAALLDAGMLSDVTEVSSDGEDLTFKRVMFAGNAVATVKLDGPVKVLTVRASAFAAASQVQEVSPLVVIPVDAASLPNDIEFVSREQKESGRPDATEARIVVSGGRALKNSGEFEQVVGGLADALGAAVGSSRALVDSGITPNSLQIGQTGKLVAPDLYIALGISGAIQHLAGMKDSKVIVAINKDAESPIFEIADYGMVADIHTVVPELISKLKR